MSRLGLVSLVAAAALAGCGSTRSGGSASLWITRDRGTRVVLVRSVPAGVTAMQALQRAAKVQTSYGGRFVQSIDGVRGSLSHRHDWFYFVNGYEADRGAGDYRLRPGDIEWWDYRDWTHALHVPVVVGAFPEPFLHGYDGKRRKAALVFESGSPVTLARRLGKLIHAAQVSRSQLAQANVLLLTAANVPFRASAKGAGQPVVFQLSVRDARRLLKDERLARFRYSGLP
ncbi:MAG TPA: DUF4430 domain-containing protein [Gaiellaceae bacterium]